VRQVTFFRAAFRSFPFLFGGIWLLVGAPFLAAGLSTAYDTMRVQERFRTEAEITDGMVLTKSIARGKNERTYRVGYRFLASDGTTIRTHAQVSPGLWDRLAEREPVRVTYLKSDPRVSRLEGAGPDRSGPAILTLIGLVVAPIGAVVFFKGVRGIARQVRLQTEGTRTYATVIDVAPTKMRINGVAQWRIRYRYQDHRGRTYGKWSAAMSPEEAEGWKAGETAVTFLRLLRRHVLVLFGAFFFCVGLGLLIAGISEALRERRFEKSGVVVNAVVVGKSLARASRDGNSSTRYEIAYRFFAEDGRPVEGVNVVDVEEWERLEPGRPFKVTYLPGAPDASRAEGTGGIAGPLIMSGIAIVFVFVGGTLSVVTGRGLVRTWRLLRIGQPARGSVIAIRETQVTVNRQRQWEIRYRYQDHVGRTHEGTSGPVAPHEAQALTDGDSIDVRFDRAEPASRQYGRTGLPYRIVVGCSGQEQSHRR